LFEEKGELRKTKEYMEKGCMLEEIFTEILTSSDGDYATQALVLAQMKPSGW